MHTFPATLVAGFGLAIALYPFTSAQAAPAPVTTIPAAADTHYAGAVTLTADLRDVGQKIFKVHEVIPVRPGPLVLLYPKWIPGEHGPTGTLDGVAGVRITSSGQPVPWGRDLKER